MKDLDIKEMREKLGMTQDTLAKMMDVHPRTIQNWETDGKVPEIKQNALRRILSNTDKETDIEQKNRNGDNHNTTNMTTNNYSNCDKNNKPFLKQLTEEMAEQRKLVIKAYEQNEKLIGIIEKLLNNNGNK